jgi:Family of unknown function (DUF5681)
MHRDKLGRFTHGQSGNMTGRPRGSRNKLGEAFITQLYTDWLEHGEAADRPVESLPPSNRLVRGISPVSPRCRQGREVAR